MSGYDLNDEKLKFRIPFSPGKYVFDIGCEQHGEYVSIVVEDGEEEEDENKASISRWKAHHIAPITVATAQ